jgi:hypothetical protein
MRSIYKRRRRKEDLFDEFLVQRGNLGGKVVGNAVDPQGVRGKGVNGSTQGLRVEIRRKSLKR